MAAKPVEARIFAYQVGFGDCFLLRFTYDDGTTKHVLIDCGTTGLPKDDASASLTRVAEDIGVKCGGALDIVVATHRHADHISGFATNAAGNASGDIIRAMKPDRVIQPWTEAPDADDDTLGPAIVADKPAFAARRQSLAEMQALAGDVVARVAAGRIPHHWPLAGQLAFIGEDNLANLSAVKNLMTMAPNSYAYHGADLKLDTLLPGIKVHVLGPPTLAQTETIRKQRSRDKDEFWQFARTRLAPVTSGDGDGPRLFPALDANDIFYGSRLPIEMRWLAGRIDEAEAEQLLGIVRALDDEMNNTSVILLFEAGSKSLLFPGDAQLENWEYALQSPLADLLDNVDVYKVGHHGSLNATPKSMWKRFTKRGDKDKPGRMTSVMSTMAGKHGKEKSETEVPRRPLVAALKAETDLHNTQDLKPGVICEEIVIDLR